LTDRQVQVWGRRWGRALQGLISYVLGALFFGLALLTSNPWLAVAALCLASFLKDFSMAVCWATCLDIGHRYSGTVSGFMNLVGNLGTFVSPPIVAYLATTSARQAAPTQITGAVGLLAGPAGDGAVQAASMVTAGATPDWHPALVYSA